MTSKKLKSPICPDKYYHIYNRGNNRERLYYHSGDYLFFLSKYKEYVAPYVETYAFCLIPNHFHFLIKTRVELSGSISVVPNQFRKLFICYTKRINYMQKRTGGLFTKNFQRIEIEDDTHLLRVVNYIHKNPIKHKIQNDFESYIYSSYKILLNNSRSKLNREEVFNWFGGMEAFILFHKTNTTDHNTFNLFNIESDDELL